MQIGPNKKMIFIFFIASIILCYYGIQELINNPEGVWEINGIIPVKAWIVDIVFISIFFINLYLVIWASINKKKITLDDTGLTLYDGKKINWDEIKKVDSLSFNFVHVYVIIHLNDSKKIVVKWHLVDCGIKRFKQELNLHIDNY